MRANTPGFIGERLVQARKSLSLSGVGLASLLSVSPTTITQYEKNKQSPRPEVMDRLCQVFGLPLAFFLRPAVDRGDRKILYRSLSSAAKAARERAEARFEWLREIVEYLSDSFDFPALNLPSIALPDDFRELTHSKIEAAAQACRELWGFGSGPIADVVLALESNGVIVSRGTLDSESLDAFSEFLANDFAYVFLGNDKGVHGRARFDAAHELGHLLLHRGIRAKDFGQPKDFKLLEAQAHRFAAAFLLPTQSFVESIWAPTIDAFRAQKEVWGVSIKGMIVRAHQVDLLSDTQYQRMLINYTRRYKDGEPGDDVKAVEMPRLLARCFYALEEHGARTREQILSDLPLAAADIEELSGLPKGYFARRGEVIQLPVLKRRELETSAPPSSEEGGQVISLTRLRAG